MTVEKANTTSPGYLWPARSTRHERRSLDPDVMARRELFLLKCDQKEERKLQAEIMQELLVKHNGEIPVRVLVHHLADRRVSVTTPVRGAGLFAGR